MLTNDRKSGKKYNIYALSDFHYAPTKRVKQVY